jgi:DNA-binding LytR/AlgR family response regulator
MIRAAIVEDDGKSAEILRRHIDRYAAESGEETAADIFGNAEQFLAAYKPVYDVVFMDIELGTILNGMEAAKRLREYDAAVNLIFVTNMTQYALQGYKVNALDYFVKPVSYYDLKLRMERIVSTRVSRSARVAIPVAGGTKAVLVSNINYIEVMNHSLTYHTTEGNYTARGASLKNLAKEFAPYGFLPCSASYLVNLRKCVSLSRDTVTVGADEIAISRRMKQKFLTRLSEVFRGRRVENDMD